MIELCRCGRPLHYTDPRVEAVMRDLVERYGPDVLVTVGDRSWRVPRHYIALHGIVGWQLPGLGFPEVE